VVGRGLGVGLARDGVARSAGSGPTVAGKGGWRRCARPAPNRGGRVAARWALETVQGSGG
jgi:hypothetical protein